MTTLEEFSDLVAAIYDAGLDPSLWEQTLKQITTVAGGSSGTLVVYDRQRGRRAQMFASNIDPVQTRKFNEYYGRLAPIIPVLKRAPAGVIVTTREVLTEDERCCEFFYDWAIPSQVGDPIFVNLLDNADGPCTLHVGRPWSSEPFATPDVLRLVRLLAPHAQRAMQAQLGFGPLSLIRDGALNLVEDWRHGCVLVSLAGQVLYANRAANEIAAARDGLRLGTSGLRAALGGEDAALQRLIRQACIGTGQGPRAGGRLAISRDSGRKPYTIQVMPLRSCHANFFNRPPAALVLIVDAERAAHLPREDLQKLFDLTPAEAEVAVLILRGHGLRYVADELRVTLSTARTHLQSAFEKTGTHRQAELVRMLSELATANLPDRLEGAAE
jgi:DNA-binding CsgD family transcriptional regulator